MEIFAERNNIMSKKPIIIAVLSIFLIGVITVMSLNFKSISTVASDKFWGFLAKQFEKEEKERNESKYGDIGRDTVYVLSDGKFQILNFPSGRDFIMYHDNQVIKTLLRRVSKYKKAKKKLYIISEEGYGIADGNTNKCKLFITVPIDEFIRGYGVDSEGNKHVISKFVEDENVQYLESFDDFTDEEKEIFEKMK